MKSQKYNLLIALFLVITINTHAQIGNYDEYGWTIIEPSDTTRTVYVSSSGGNDDNDGLSESSPVKTLEHANGLIRDGYPDHLLLKRGDEWASVSFGRWKSGKSADEPLVLSYYGETGARPVIKLEGEFININGDERNHVAIIGIDFYRSISDPSSEDFLSDDLDAASSGTILRFVGRASNILVEDCLFRFGSLNVQGYPTPGVDWIDNFIFRRNIVVDNWADSTTYQNHKRPQGMFITDAKNILIEENVFDHNGWSEVIENAGANQFNHNIYMHDACDEKVLIRGNIFSRASSHGIQMRSGGACEMNFFVRNCIGSLMGYSEQQFRINGEDYFEDNITLEGRTQMAFDYGPQTGALWGMTLGDSFSNTFYCNDNIVAHLYQTDGATNTSPYPSWAPNEYGNGNIGWDWGGDTVSDGGTDWTDPNRLTSDYQAYLGRTPSFEAYIEMARNREIHTMPWDYTAYAVIDYIREGFNKDTVTPPYLYNREHLTCIPVTGVTLNSSSVTMDRGKVLQLTATVAPEEGVCDQSVTWTSNNEAIASVDSTGLITSLTAGTTEITATTVDGGHADVATVTVNDTPLGTGSGKETFTNLTAPNSKVSTGTYVGDNGEIWSYRSVQKVDGITDTTAQIRKLNGHIETVLPDGLIDLSFTMSSTSEYGGIPTIEVYINDKLYGSCSPESESETKTCTITGINAFGKVKLDFASVTTYTWLDDISWTDNSGKTVSTVYQAEANEMVSIYPNPFNTVTTIKYSVQNAGKVLLKIFDISGHEVGTLINKNQAPGEYSIPFDGSNIDGGIYFCVFSINKVPVSSSKLVLVK